MQPDPELSASYDVVIVGARCAGAATALLLARRGLRVLVVDRGRYGTDTLSTHALMRGATLQLHRWGVLPWIQREGTPPVHETTFFYDGEAITIPIKPRDGVDALYAPRRTVLDRALVDAALASGATVRHEVRLMQLTRSASGRVNGVVVNHDREGQQRISADLVIGADGLRSTVATLAGATIYRSGQHASGVVYGYWRGLRVDGYEWHFTPGVGAGVIPTNDDTTCVFTSLPAAAFADAFRGSVAAGYHRLLSEVSPALAAKVAHAERVGTLHGFGGQAGFFRQSYGPGWALVGDAGYFKDPLTAHGITDAMRDAELLATAVGRGPDGFDEYQRTRDELATALFDVTDEIASFSWDLPRLRALHESLAAAMAAEVKDLVARRDRLAMSA
jgi:2-polyprenyl-6-methoxyphenol hydroxylase-like FAD-dependent oxidoreductase